MELKPCPFCGSDAIETERGSLQWNIHCRKCMCHFYRNTWNDLIKAWNRRTPSEGGI